MTPSAGADAVRSPRMPGARPFPRLKLPQASTIAFVGFWVVAFATLISLPGLARIVVSAVENIPTVGRGVAGITRIVAVMCVVAAVTARFPPLRALGAPGFFFLATIALHNIIGTAVSMARDPEFTFSWTQQYRLLGMLVVAVAATGVAEVAGRIGLDRLLKGLLAILVVVCLGVLVAPVLAWYGSIGYGVDVGRSIGTLSGPNHSAVVACLTLSLACAMITWRGKSALSIFAICMAVPAVVITASRTGMVLLVVVAALHILHAAKKHGATAVVLPGLIALSVFASLAWLIDVATDSLLLQASLGRLGSLESNRPELWRYGLALIMESPFVGNGIDTLMVMKNTPMTCMAGLLRIPCGVHMQYLQFFGEAGILPFATFLLFFASTFARCPWPPASLAKTVSLVWTICFALYGLVANNLFVQLTNFFVIGIICGLLSVGDTVDRQIRSQQKAKPLE